MYIYINSVLQKLEKLRSAMHPTILKLTFQSQKKMAELSNYAMI